MYRSFIISIKFNTSFMYKQIKLETDQALYMAEMTTEKYDKQRFLYESKLNFGHIS